MREISINKHENWRSIQKYNLLFELACPLLVIAVQLLLGKYFQDFIFVKNTSLRWIPIIISVGPVLFSYILLRYLFPPLMSSLFVSFMFLVLSIVNRLKVSLTNEPLSWTDLSSTANFSIIGHYLTLQHIAIVLTAIAMCLLSLIINPYKKISIKRFIWQSSACLAILPVSLYPYNDNIYKEFADKFECVLGKVGVSFISWDWITNVQLNGLPLHIIQTSKIKVPSPPTDEDRRLFSRLSSSQLPPVDRPSNVIFVLCEGGWHDEIHFKKPFLDLEKIGFKQLRAISPVYGGNTVNASFELLTGIPAGGAVSGIIYQDYSALISSDAHTYPRYLKKYGYKTIAAHNNYKKFWKRDVIKPKLGFDKFIGLEDMNYIKESSWPDDSILFESAINILEEHSTQNFLYLTTVYTHGDFTFNNDFGQKDYLLRLNTTMERISSFAKKIKTIEPDSLIIVIGDHKPALTKYFFEKGIFPKSQFTSVGDKNEDFQFSRDFNRALRGDVPVYVYHPDKTRVKRFIAKANGKPFFCLSQYLDEEFTQVNLPAFNFSSNNSICSDFVGEKYLSSVHRYPGWLYALSIFDRK